MQFLLKAARWIDQLSEWVGQITFGLTLVMVVVGAYNAITRYLGRYIGTNLSSNRYIEVQWYLFSLIFLFGAAYVLKHNSHVRVDILYSRLSRKAKAWIDLLGALLLLLPMCFAIIYYSVPSVISSWQVLEQSSDPDGLARYPLKTAVIVAIALLGLQGISELIKQLAIILNVTPPAAPTEREAQP